MPDAMDTKSKSLTLSQRFSRFFFNYPGWLLFLLLVLPLAWLGVFYLGSLLILALNSFYYVDDFSGVVIREVSLQTYNALFTPANLEVVGRTVLMASLVTIAAALIAFPWRILWPVMPGSARAV
jgi:putative spermidine/putrescine transport system permease protein